MPPLDGVDDWVVPKAQGASQPAPEVDDWIVPNVPARTPPPVANPLSTDALNRITGAIIGGAKEGFGSPGTILTDDAQAKLDAIQRQGGVKGHLAQLGSTVADDIGTIGGSLVGAGGALLRGGQAGVAQVGAELGLPRLGRALALIPEAFMGSPEMLRIPEAVEPPVAAGPRIEPRVTMPPGPGAPVADEPLALAGPVELRGTEAAPHATAVAPTEVDDWTVPERHPSSSVLPAPEVDDWAVPESTAVLPAPPETLKIAGPATDRPTAPEPANAHGGPWSEVGKNHQGDPVYENPNGVRATMENGVPWMEATKEHPERGRVPHDEGKRSERVQVVETPAAAEKPAEELGQNPQTPAIPSAETAPEEVTPTTEHATPAKTRAPRQRREPNPYEIVPKAPKRLIQFLREPTVINRGTIHEQTIPGGVRDVGGDVKAAIGGAKGRPGLINNAAGRHLDDATLRAWEEGYFPEHDQRPEINDLLNAIRDDHEGRARHSIHDQDAVDAHHGALAQNDEIDRLAAQHGIATSGLTRDQFFDALAEHLEHQSLEDAAMRHAEMEASLGTDVDDLDRESKQWNGDEVYGNDPPRTLEDLEHEYRQEDAAGTSGESSPDHDGRGHATSPEGAGEESARQVGRDARSSGRDDEAGAADEGERRDVDLLGAPHRETPAPRASEPTIRNDPSQAVMPGMEASAHQAQAARDAAGPRSDQKRADEGLFARPETAQPELMEVDPKVGGEPKSGMEPQASTPPTRVAGRAPLKMSRWGPGGEYFNVPVEFRQIPIVDPRAPSPAVTFGISADGQAYYAGPSYPDKTQIVRAIDAYLAPFGENTYVRSVLRPEDYKHLSKSTHRGSKNHATGESEGGLSVAHVAEIPSNYAYLVKGRRIGSGSDFEPLLDTATASPASPLMKWDKFAALQQKAIDARIKQLGLSRDEYRALVSGHKKIVLPSAVRLAE